MIKTDKERDEGSERLKQEKVLSGFWAVLAFSELLDESRLGSVNICLQRRIKENKETPLSSPLP